jgi:peptidoglycan/LPS O-acetylase OafA/YrhL
MWTAAGTPAEGDPSQTQGWSVPPEGWGATAQGWAVPAPGAVENRRRGPGAAVYAGVLLVVFGTIALADAVIPGLAGVNLGPALLVALGVALLIGSVRRTADGA